MLFQSTPPHGGRPARPRRRYSPEGSFNPRPRTGGDLLPSETSERDGPFQSTPPHGGRPDDQAGLGDRVEVSIHAPARGATPHALHRMTLPAFQSTPPHGGRPARAFLAASDQMFQSTPPHGGRLGFSSRP